MNLEKDKMSRATVEFDFFGMEKQTTASKSQFQKFLDRRRSFRDVQGAIKMIDPEVIKSVISSGATSHSNENGNKFKPFSVPSTPKEDQNQIPVLPFHVPIARASAEKFPETAPLTIIYNGTVSVFNVPRDKAESILKVAMERSPKTVETVEPNVSIPSSERHKLLQNLKKDLPIPRRKSLERFLEKRKERLTSASPYTPQM